MADLQQNIISPKTVGNLHNLLLERVRLSPEALAYRCFNAEKTSGGI